ncbi:sensor histidine kinase [Fischerella thermalis]|uniref:sensor histidine kinase n=1 Tax=Fischerella thermalis TaxID=372787 RepID=UPI001A09186B|nr:HAMP domain-containing sensor histidine kinase [Fischerella thermalis]MBF1989446.1 HAMP domain-containing histidine kinase [Fischerella thermalis M58_A2018_009]MBF2059757.1 HAMP domain-containing histidine kinase [Fischerella thermalis M66_A2018_004]
MSNLFHRSRRNLARWFTLSMGSILIVFASIVYFGVVSDCQRAFDRELYSKSRVMAAGIRYGLQQGKWQVQLDDVPLLGNNTLFIERLETEIAYARWYSPEKKLLRFIKEKPASNLKISSGFETLQIVVSENKTQSPIWLRQITLPVLQDGVLLGYLQIASPLTPVQETLTQLRLLLAVGVPLGIFAIALTGWFLGGLAMQPIHESYERLDRFTAYASHELRNPLAKVLSQAQLVLMSLRETDSEVRSRLHIIIKTTKAISHLVNDLLFLARHKGELERRFLKQINLVEFLENLIQEQILYCEYQEITLTTEFPTKTVNISVEPDLLRQAVLNLLNNAIKYTPPGGTVKIRLLSSLHTVNIQVEDSGTGIPAQDLPHIFEQFYRSDAHRSQSGLGLGLAIAQQIVQAHRGKITVNSIVGRGSCFQIELPLK